MQNYFVINFLKILRSNHLTDTQMLASSCLTYCNYSKSCHCHILNNHQQTLALYIGKIMHLSMQIPTHPLPGTSGDLIVSRSSNPAPGMVLLYTQSVVYYMLRILLLGLFAKLFAPRGASFAPPLWQIPTHAQEGVGGDLH